MPCFHVILTGWSLFPIAQKTNISQLFLIMHHYIIKILHHKMHIYKNNTIRKQIM